MREVKDRVVDIENSLGSSELLKTVLEVGVFLTGEGKERKRRERDEKGENNNNEHFTLGVHPNLETVSITFWYSAMISSVFVLINSGVTSNFNRISLTALSPASGRVE